MTPERHIRRLLRWMTKVRNEVAVMHTEEHFGSPGIKGLDTVERDIEDVIRDVERVRLLDTTVK